MGDKDSSQTTTRRFPRRPSWLNTYETDDDIIKEACKRTTGVKGNSQKDLFKDDIYDCIHRLFKGHPVQTVRNYIKNKIGDDTRKIRTVLNKMNNPDAECERAKNNIPEGQYSMELKKYKNINFRKDETNGVLIKESPIEEIVEEYPIIKKYTGTERTSFINEHYKKQRLPTIIRTIENMLKKKNATNIIIDEGTGKIKSFEIDIKPDFYEECGKCWLCNEMVYYYRSNSANEATSCGDCEHVAGIIIGMLTGLLAYQKQEIMVYGYQPSHIHCNRFKSDDITIKFENNLWVPDQNSIEKIVQWIANDDDIHKSEYCPQFKKRLFGAIDYEKSTITRDKHSRDIIYDKSSIKYDEKVVEEYKTKCRNSIQDYTSELCTKINDHYGLTGTIPDSQKMSVWCDIIASLFKPAHPSILNGGSGKEKPGSSPVGSRRKVDQLSRSDHNSPARVNKTGAEIPHVSPANTRRITTTTTPAIVRKGKETGEEMEEETGEGKGDIFGVRSIKKGEEEEETGKKTIQELAGHTLNLLTVAGMLHIVNGESFKECMLKAGNILEARGKKEEGHSHGDSQGTTQGEEFTEDITDASNTGSEGSDTAQVYNTLQYYEKYKNFINGKFKDCNHVIYISDPAQDLQNYMKSEHYRRDKITVEDGKTKSDSDQVYEVDDDCFATIYETILCEREDNRKIGGVPAEEEQDMLGGMLKTPKQRKTRKHNQKKEKKTTRKNKQHTKNYKRTFKKKSHKKSNKSQ